MLRNGLNPDPGSDFWTDPNSMNMDPKHCRWRCELIWIKSWEYEGLTWDGQYLSRDRWTPWVSRCWAASLSRSASPWSGRQHAPASRYPRPIGHPGQSVEERAKLQWGGSGSAWIRMDNEDPDPKVNNVKKRTTKTTGTKINRSKYFDINSPFLSIIIKE